MDTQFRGLRIVIVFLVLAVLIGGVAYMFISRTYNSAIPDCSVVDPPRVTDCGQVSDAAGSRIAITFRLTFL